MLESRANSGTDVQDASRSCCSIGAMKPSIPPPLLTEAFCRPVKPARIAHTIRAKSISLVVVASSSSTLRVTRAILEPNNDGESSARTCTLTDTPSKYRGKKFLSGSFENGTTRMSNPEKSTSFLPSRRDLKRGSTDITVNSNCIVLSPLGLR